MHLTSLVRMSSQVAYGPNLEFGDDLGRSVQRGNSLLKQLTKLKNAFNVYVHR
jgi:hypothetical protein